MPFFRNFMRPARRCMMIASRGKKDLPIAFWRRRASPWDDPWVSNFFRSVGPRGFDDPLRDGMRMMDRMFNMSPFRSGAAHGIDAEIEKAVIGKDGLHIKMNVSHYEPNDLSIKVVEDRLIISGKHSQKPDNHGYVTREFTRELLIPEEVEQDTLASRLTDDGYLVISARVKAEKEPEGRNITIEREESSDADASSKSKE